MRQIAGPLLEWFTSHARILPWRDAPTPYHVWISEIMLQQTRVEAVLPYYQRFLAALPDVASLAKVEEDVLLKLWQGLGYYNRARNLKKAAQLIQADYDGELPASPQELQKLPGIGPYTAGAIASIAFGVKVPAVDGNVLRVLSRLLAYPKDILQNKPELTDRLTAILPNQISAFNQALMELGAIICLPNGQPKCSQCPLHPYCKAFQQGNMTDYPIKAKKKPRTLEQRTIYLLEHDGKIALFKRPNSGLLPGLYEYLNQPGQTAPDQFSPLGILQAHPLPAHQHIFTHKEWQMSAYHLLTQNPHPTALYATREELTSLYPLPSAFAPYTAYWLELR